MTNPATAAVAASLLESRLDMISGEMGIAMVEASRSPMFSESHDFSCFITDARGRLISQADGLPIHSGGGGIAVTAVLDAWGDDIHEGDVFLLNDPYLAGGNHLPDLTVVRPVHYAGRLVAFTCNRAHQVDIGGGALGTYNARAVEIFDEGLRIPAVKLWSRGERSRDVIALVTANSRLPEVLIGDIEAMVGSTRIGAARLVEVVLGRSSVDEFDDVVDQLLDHAETLAKARLAAVPDGVYHGRESMAHDGTPAGGSVEIHVAITFADGRVTVDFTGTSPQVRSFKNSSVANTYSATCMALSALLGPDVPRNAGTYRMIEVIAPPGTVVSATDPAPVTFGTLHPAFEIIAACWDALADCLPARVPAGWGKPCHPVTTGTDGDARFVMYHFGALPGSGAMVSHDGIDQVGLLPTLGAMAIPNLEVYERIYPVEFLSQEMRCDSGGAGAHRGGSGVDYAVRMRVPATHQLRGEAQQVRTGRGRTGGHDGSLGRTMFAERDGDIVDLPVHGVANTAPGTLYISSAGGGGLGDPFERPAEIVRADVVDGLVSIAAARDHYGVVLDDGFVVDTAATEQLRAGRASS